jgi:hypothetical protein
MLSKALMRMKMIKVIHIRLQNMREWAQTDEQKMIQALAPNRTKETLAHSISIGCANRCFEDLDVGAGSHSGELRTVLAVVVSDQVFRSSTPNGVASRSYWATQASVGASVTLT